MKYNHTGLPPSTRLSYKVIAHCSDSSTQPSHEAEYYTQPPQIPGTTVDLVNDAFGTCVVAPGGNVCGNPYRKRGDLGNHKVSIIIHL